MSKNDADSEDDYQPIRALNDLLFCERRCALHRLEGLWVENRYTLEGTAGHGRAHAEPTRAELGASAKLVRHMWLRSDRLRLVGIADVVEFGRNPVGQEVPYPIEYKRGRKRRWDNDDVQLCAQALCLEEMLSVAVPAGAIYHIRSRRRRAVAFDPALRSRTEEAARRLHELVESGGTPPPVLKPRCRGCSMVALCMPTLLAQQEPVQRYCRELYAVEEMKKGE
jgi:CRISPR-associated exonuclease Cas4